MLRKAERVANSKLNIRMHRNWTSNRVEKLRRKMRNVVIAKHIIQKINSGNPVFTANVIPNVITRTLRSGHILLVDEKDYDTVAHKRWTFRSYKRKNGTARVTLKDSDGRTAGEYILGITAPNKYCIHLNGNPLDLRRANLKEGTFNDVAIAIAKRKSKTSCKGVHPSGKKFIAKTRIGGVAKYLGSFETQAEAALAYDKAVLQHGSRCAFLNIMHNEFVYDWGKKHMPKETADILLQAYSR